MLGLTSSYWRSPNALPAAVLRFESFGQQDPFPVFRHRRSRCLSAALPLNEFLVAYEFVAVASYPSQRFRPAAELPVPGLHGVVDEDLGYLRDQRLESHVIAIPSARRSVLPVVGAPPGKAPVITDRIAQLLES